MTYWRHYYRAMRGVMVQSGFATSEELVGCTQAEIEELIVGQVCRPPPVFSAFLEVFGRQMGSIFVGTDIFFPEGVGIADGARELMREWKVDDVLSDRSYIVSLHQGYDVEFFKDVSEPDPELWRYVESYEPPHKLCDSFNLRLEAILGTRIDGFEEVFARVRPSSTP